MHNSELRVVQELLKWLFLWLINASRMIKGFYTEPCLEFNLTKLRICILSAKFNNKICAVYYCIVLHRKYIIDQICVFGGNYILVFWYFFEKRYRFHKFKSTKELIWLIIFSCVTSQPKLQEIIIMFFKVSLFGYALYETKKEWSHFFCICDRAIHAESLV